MDNEEVWKDITGYEDKYQISNKGKVASLARQSLEKNRWGGMSLVNTPFRILKPSVGAGYMYLWLWKNGRKKKHMIHRLVLNHFVGPCPEGMEGCHNDGDFKNNVVDNLRWDTHKGNHQDRIRHGTNNRGEKNGCAVIGEKEVVEIREMYSTGKYLMKEIASKYGVSSTTVRLVVRGMKWKHIDYLPESNFGKGHARLKNRNLMR